jgi:hypothetical protein
MYNPFEKNIEELTIDDIKALQSKQVKEGFYVEYKSVFVRETLKIAHSIASFANTHGGWYFVGIGTDASNLPISFAGFSMAEQPKPIEHLRDIIKDKIDPFPVYYTNLIEFDDGKAILVVQIPESDETPHITKDGRIYRRNAEGSDPSNPVAEPNRYVLDKLYEKSAKLQNEIERFCQKEIPLSKAEENNSFLEAYLMPYPLGLLNIDQFTKIAFLESLKKTMNDPTKAKFTDDVQMETQISFNNVGASWRSIIFRQCNPKSLKFTTLTFELFVNGNAKIIIPFEFIPVTSKRTSPAWEKLTTSMIDEDISLFRIIDGFKTLNVFVTMLQKYIDILISQNWQNNILIAYRLENTWRTILFLDSAQFIKHIEANGVPICQRENAWIPRLEKRSMIYDMPKYAIFQLIEFFEVSTHFGIFPQECGSFTSEWMQTLIKPKSG